MEHCAYCGESVGSDGLFVEEEVFCSEECMRDFGAGESYDDEEDDDDDDDYDDDDDSVEEDEDEDEDY